MKQLNNKFIKILMIMIISIFCYNNLKAQSLDLSGVAEQNFRTELRPILSIMASQNELPAIMGFYNSSRKLMFSSNIVNFYNIFDGNKNGIYVPAFWGGFVTSPNLSLFMQLSQGQWKGENISSFGPVINFIWGEEEKENVINISINHLRGPDDFRVKDISLSLMKKKKIAENWVYYGIAPHYIKANIKVEDTGINKSINETIYHFRVGFYKKIKFIDMGLEIDLTKETIITKYKLVLIL